MATGAPEGPTQLDPGWSRLHAATYRVRNTFSLTRLGVFFGAAVVVGVVVLAVLVGSPFYYKSAIDLLLAAFGIALHLALGAVIAAAVCDHSGDRFHKKLLTKMGGYNLAGIICSAIGVAILGLFWYFAVTYSTIVVWTGVLSAASLIGGFVLGRWAAGRSDADPTAQRTRNLADQFEPGVITIGALVGILIAAVLLWKSAADDTNAVGRAPVPVTVPANATYNYKNYVALGDSYAAGEGNNPQGVCHRSPKDAYPLILARNEGWQVHSYACSGAVIDDIFNPPQFFHSQTGHHGPQITSPPDKTVGLVTVTIGGNDALFSKVVIQCVEHPSCMWGNFPPAGVNEAVNVDGGKSLPLEHQWGPDTIEAIAGKLDAPKTGLFARLKDQYPNARIVLVGYPYLFPDGPAPDRDLACAAILRRVDEPDRAELRYMQDRFNDLLFETAVSGGVGFINPNVVWAGHEPCGDKGQWTRSIEAYLNTEILGTGPFHPNPTGQQALAALVACYLKKEPKAAGSQAFTMPTTWLTPPQALRLANGALFPSEWGTQSSDLTGCNFGQLPSTPVEATS